jgi:hypothetical protein
MPISPRFTRYKPGTNGNLGPDAADQALWVPPKWRTGLVQSPRMAKRASLSIFEHEDVFGTVTADTTHYVYGSQGLKLTCVPGGNTTIHKALSLDLTHFDDSYNTASGTDDYIKLCVRVDNLANFGSLRVRLTSDAVGVYTNYFETTIMADQLRNGQWAFIYIRKSDWVSHGSASWASITAAQIRGVTNEAGTVQVTIDDFRLLRASDAFTQENVQDAEPTLGSLTYQYEQVSQCIKQVADIMGCIWRVDANRDIHFQGAESIGAAFSLSETSNNFIPDSLELVNDLSTLRNQVYVRGGDYQASSATFQQVADGSKANFLTPYKIKNISVTLDGVAKTVGIDNIDNPASFDCLYNFEEKNLKFASTPTNGQVLAVTGNPILPVIVKKSDPGSIAEYGVYESIVLDNSITTLQGGRDRATAELKAYRDALVEGHFSTYTPGLEAGTTILIDLPTRGISASYIIKQVDMQARGPADFLYKVTLISTRTQGVIEWLLAQITKDRKNITTTANEVTDLAASIEETVTPSDAWALGTEIDFTESQASSDSMSSDFNLGTVFVAGPYNESSHSDPKRAFIVEGSLVG